MRIQHNIMAMNAYRNYNINTSLCPRTWRSCPPATRSTAPATTPLVWLFLRRCVLRSPV